MKQFFSFIIFIFLTAISACDNHQKQQDDGQLKAPDEEENAKRLSVTVNRLDKDIFLADKMEPDAFVSEMKKKYGDFFSIYCSKIIKIGDTSQVMFIDQLKGFTNDPDILSIQQDVNKIYDDFGEIEHQIEAVLNNYHYFFPDSLIPKIVTMISGFNYNVVTTDSTIAISLDMYLGNKSRFYEWLNFPQYKVNNMHPEMIVSDLLKALSLSSFIEPTTKDDLISHMIYHGKIIYFIRACYPELDENLAFGFKQDQLEWCYDNEVQIWKHFIDQSLFYTVDHKNVVKYINEGPFTAGFPNESPGKVGIWLGYQIVKSFMKNNKLSLEQLMHHKDARTIFAQSKYKPAK
jgi:hypothetical protein